MNREPNPVPRLWPKVVNDFCFVLMFGILYAGLYRHCPAKDRVQHQV